MEEKINIAEILKDKKNGLRLYSPIFGECVFCCVRKDTNDICVKKHNGVKEFFDSKGLYYNTGEVMLFPSKEMRDWRKFTLKKGDVLVSNDGKIEIIFEKFNGDTYQSFTGKHQLDSLDENLYYQDGGVYPTYIFNIETEDAAQTYIKTIEEKLDGKLNLESLEIEKAQPEFKDGDIVALDTRYIDSDDVIVESFIVRGDYKYGDNLKYYAGCSNNMKTNIVYNSSIIINKTSVRKESLRLATEAEKQQLFSALKKEGKRWDSEKKQIMNFKPNVDELKPFDKVLVRDGKDEIWEPAFFFRYLSQFSGYNYQTVGGEWRVYCIPYIGNESLLGTTKDVEG